MSDKITLDRNTFKALAADTRIRILKELNKKRKTQSELANILKMSTSTIKEHLDNLESVSLVRKIDEGYKWKYYELTKKGKNIITPTETRIWISLGITLLALGLAINNLMIKLKSINITTTETLQAIPKASKVMESASQTTTKDAPQIMATEQAPHLIIPYTDIVLVITIATIMGIMLGYLIRSRR